MTKWYDTALSNFIDALQNILDNKLDIEDAFSGSYNDLTNKPSIPSKTSHLTNDSGFLTSHQDISGKIDTAGTGLSKSGTTLNHSNSITAQTSTVFKKIKYDAQGHITGTANVEKSDITGLGVPGSDTTYSTATQSTNGLMSSTDKTKLDGIATGANNYSHPSTHSASMIIDESSDELENIDVGEGADQSLINYALSNEFYFRVKTYQGTSNNGKFLKVNNSGNVACESVTIPSASSSTPSADVSGGAIGSSSNYAKADHQHPLSNAYATANHNQASSTITDMSTVQVVVTYTDNTSETLTLFKQISSQ